jgi:hypothetical protein
MKPITFILVSCIVVSMNATSQDSLKAAREFPYKPVSARIDLPQGQYINALLMAIRDSSIYIYQKGSAKHGQFQKENIYDESTWEKYHYSYIVRVKVSNKKLKSWLWPTTIVTGVLAGAFVGASLSKNNSGLDGAYASVGSVFLGGLLGGAVGTATGLIIANGSAKRYLINGEWKNLEEMKASLNY